MENKELSLEEMQALVSQQAEKLSKDEGVPVMPLLFKENEEWIVGFVRKPTRTTVRMAVDKMEKFGRIEAGDLILQASLMPGVSDERILSEKPEFDGINMGACLQCLDLIEVNLSMVKKNGTSTK